MRGAEGAAAQDATSGRHDYALLFAIVLCHRLPVAGRAQVRYERARPRKHHRMANTGYRSQDARK